MDKEKNIYSDFPFIEPFYEYMPVGLCPQFYQLVLSSLLWQMRNNVRKAQGFTHSILVAKLMNETWDQEPGLLDRATGDLCALDSIT